MKEEKGRERKERAGGGRYNYGIFFAMYKKCLKEVNLTCERWVGLVIAAGLVRVL